MTVIAAFAASRFLHAVCLMLLFGSSLLLVLIPSSSLAFAIAGRLASKALLLALLALAGLLAWLPLEAATIGGDWHSAVDGTMMVQIVTMTVSGRAWCLRMIMGVVTVIMVYGCTTFRPAGWLRWIVLAGGLSLAGLSLSGHAAANSGWLRILHEAVDALHVLAAGAWLGSLVPFFYFLIAIRNADLRQDAAKALIAFSQWGHAAVAITLSSGVANTWLILRGWPFQWHLIYQVLLCVKIAFTIAMVLIAVVNRYLWVPRIQAQPDLAIETIRRLTVFGALSGLTAVALVSVFGILSPAASS